MFSLTLVRKTSCYQQSKTWIALGYMALSSHTKHQSKSRRWTRTSTCAMWAASSTLTPISNVSQVNKHKLTKIVLSILLHMVVIQIKGMMSIMNLQLTCHPLKINQERIWTISITQVLQMGLWGRKKKNFLTENKMI